MPTLGTERTQRHVWIAVRLRPVHASHHPLFLCACLSLRLCVLAVPDGGQWQRLESCAAFVSGLSALLLLLHCDDDHPWLRGHPRGPGKHCGVPVAHNTRDPRVRSARGARHKVGCAVPRGIAVRATPGLRQSKCCPDLSSPALSLILSAEAAVWREAADDVSRIS